MCALNQIDESEIELKIKIINYTGTIIVGLIPVLNFLVYFIDKTSKQKNTNAWVYAEAAISLLNLTSRIVSFIFLCVAMSTIKSAVNKENVES